MQDLLERLREFMGVYDDTTESRIPLSLWSILLSAVLGLLLGLFIGWVLWPVEWENIRPTHLDVDSRAQYVAAIADTYVANGESQEAYDLAIRRLSGMNVRQDLGLAYKYFYGELADDEYAQALQPDRDIRLFNLDRLSYALNIDPAVAVNSVDMSGIATIDSTVGDGTDVDSVENDSTGGIIDGQLNSDQSLDLLPESEQNLSTADEGGTTFGEMLQSVFACLTALALILGGLYLLNHWWKARRLSGDFEDGNQPEHIGPYRDKPKTGTIGSTVEPYDEDEVYDDDGDFDYFDEELNAQTEYEPDDAWQTTVEEVNPYRPPPAQSIPNDIAPSDSEGDARRYSSGTAPSALASIGPSAQYQSPNVESFAPQQPQQPRQSQPPPQASLPTSQEAIRSAPAPTMRTSPVASPTSTSTVPASVGSGEVLTQFTARYQRGTQQYEQQRAIVASGNMERGEVDGLNIGEYGMGVNIKNGILQSDAENVIALDVWLFDKTDQQGPRNQTRVLISEYVIDHDLSDTIMRDGVTTIAPIVPQKGEEFEIRGTTLRLVCKVIEAVYVNSGEMKGVFESVAVDMTVIHG